MIHATLNTDPERAGNATVDLSAVDPAGVRLEVRDLRGESIVTALADLTIPEAEALAHALEVTLEVARMVRDQDDEDAAP